MSHGLEGPASDKLGRVLGQTGDGQASDEDHKAQGIDTAKAKGIRQVPCGKDDAGAH
ncbi:MAG: hypothetical protein HYU29_07135 [Chloroflexi bacterium]|nr:hypothetical protein [Chloroflexota bacterium]